MLERLKRYLHKNIKVHLGPDWAFFGELVLIDEANDIILLQTESNCEITVTLSRVVTITHVPANEKGSPRPKESQYHPTKHMAYRR